MVLGIFCEGSPGGRSETTGIGFMLGVNERWSYRCADVKKYFLWIQRTVYFLREHVSQFTSKVILAVNRYGSCVHVAL